MDIHRTIEYAACVEDVIDMLLDEDFQDRKCRRTGALEHEVSVTYNEGEDTATIATRRTMSTGSFPDFIKGLVGESVVVSQVDTWGPEQEDGARHGTIHVNVLGTPVELTGALSLIPWDATSTRETVTGELRVKVPLIGGRVEKAALPAVEKALIAEKEVGDLWLGELPS